MPLWQNARIWRRSFSGARLPCSNISCRWSRNAMRHEHMPAHEHRSGTVARPMRRPRRIHAARNARSENGQGANQAARRDMLVIGWNRSRNRTRWWSIRSTPVAPAVTTSDSRQRIISPSIRFSNCSTCHYLSPSIVVPRNPVRIVRQRSGPRRHRAPSSRPNMARGSQPWPYFCISSTSYHWRGPATSSAP